MFYPDKLPQRRWFEFYSQHFQTLELNVTFYRFPQLSASLAFCFPCFLLSRCPKIPSGKMPDTGGMLPGLGGRAPATTTLGNADNVGRNPGGKIGNAIKL
ncbi:DUF72 domain-containing protein [Hymenobacter sp. DG25A]|uniref:DUF72 domain-containing protein n=1 Tax=Hymenobacter sp. DG25A TaxID=1385663 RepID=UPI003977D872